MSSATASVESSAFPKLPFCHYKTSKRGGPKISLGAHVTPWISSVHSHRSDYSAVFAPWISRCPRQLWDPPVKENSQDEYGSAFYEELKRAGEQWSSHDLAGALCDFKDIEYIVEEEELTSGTAKKRENRMFRWIKGVQDSADGFSRSAHSLVGREDDPKQAVKGLLTDLMSKQLHTYCEERLAPLVKKVIRDESDYQATLLRSPEGMEDERISELRDTLVALHRATKTAWINDLQTKWSDAKLTLLGALQTLLGANWMRNHPSEAAETSDHADAAKLRDVRLLYDAESKFNTMLREVRGKIEIDAKDAFVESCKSLQVNPDELLESVPPESFYATFTDTVSRLQQSPWRGTTQTSGVGVKMEESE